MQQLVIDSNGKIPIPLDIMRKYGLAPGSKVNFNDANDKLTIEPVDNGTETTKKTKHERHGWLSRTQ
jgi:AbrB family looped-hinge helix DNA binding protein